MALTRGRAARRVRGWNQELPTRLPDIQTALRRRIIERAFAWMGHNWRMTRDYGFLPTPREAWIYLSMLRPTLMRLSDDCVQSAFHYRPAA